MPFKKSCNKKVISVLFGIKQFDKEPLGAFSGYIYLHRKLINKIKLKLKTENEK